MSLLQNSWRAAARALGLAACLLSMAPSTPAQIADIKYYPVSQRTPRRETGVITAGPDGALWFTENLAIGRITTSGAITEYPLPGGFYSDITAGPDSALWFTEMNGDTGKIGRITTAGGLTEYTLPSIVPTSITVGPDGALWFAGHVLGTGGSGALLPRD